MGLHLGYAESKDAENGNGLAGAHLEIGVLPWLGLQGAVDYRLVETHPVQGNTASGEIDVKSVPVTATARLYLPIPSNWRLFAAAGAGWYYLLYEYSDELIAVGFEDRHENTFGWHVGAGVEVKVAPQVSLYGEGRGVFVDPDQALDSETFEAIERFDYDSLYFAAGFNLHF